MTKVKKTPAPVRISLEFYSCPLPQFLKRIASVLLALANKDLYGSIKELVAKLDVMNSTFVTLCGEIANGNNSLIIQRDTLGEKIKKLMFTISNNVAVIADGDIEILRHCGFKLDNERTPAPPVHAPERLTLKAVQGQNQINSTTRAVLSRQTYYKEIAVADPNIPVSAYKWSRESVSRVKYAFTGLIPGTNYAVRIGAVSKTGEVFYSDIVYCICS